MADAYCDRVSRTFGNHAKALRPVAEVLRECGLLAQAMIVERVIAESVEASTSTYEDTNPHGLHPTGRQPIQE